MKDGPADRRSAARRAALRALRKATRAAERAGVALSPWEGEFLSSVRDRVQTFGRAFADPEKGAPGAALSGRQTVKLREIAGKARVAAPGKAEVGQTRPRATLRRRKAMNPSDAR